MASRPLGSGIAWTIFDERIADVARQFEDFRQAGALGAVLTAANVEELAERTAALPRRAGDWRTVSYSGRPLGRP
jgi:hypothetical protein